MNGVLIAALVVSVVVAALLKAAEYQGREDKPTTTIPGALLPCTTTGCGRPAVTIAAGRLACDNCAQYLTARAVGA